MSAGQNDSANAGGRVAAQGRRLRMTVGRGTILWTLVTAAFLVAIVLANVIGYLSISVPLPAVLPQAASMVGRM